MSNQTVTSLIAQLGGNAEVARWLGVTSARVTYVTNAGVIPTSWWPALKELANSRGVDLPMGLFGWRKPANVATTDNDTISPKFKGANI